MNPDKWEGLSMVLDKLNDEKFGRARGFILLIVMPFGLSAILKALVSLIQAL